jgi:hypothetical protein
MKLAHKTFFLFAAFAAIHARAETVAFWPFDEPVGLYPSSVLADHAGGAGSLVLGPGGSVVPGKFGGALSTAPQETLSFPKIEDAVLFGFTQLPTPEGRTVPPMSWLNARFAALNTAGEKHLRKEATQENPSTTGLNLGAFDWTVEFWYRPAGAPADDSGAVVFEMGAGPRGENDHVTALSLDRDRRGFTFVNQPGGVRLRIPSDATVLGSDGGWAHLAFVYEAASRKLTHFVDGRAQNATEPVAIKALPTGDESYFSVGRDARWERALPGAIDELRFSRGRVYTAVFTPPGSFVTDPDAGSPASKPIVTQPLLFADDAVTEEPVNLGSRQHLLIDDALFPVHQDVTFEPVPPQKIELAFEIKGSLRKHVTVIEGDDGVIRIYSPVGKNDRLAVRTSRDGINFEIPKLSTIEPDYPNIVTEESAGTPGIFIDPVAPPEERWKLVSGDDGQGIYLFTSPDGYKWKRLPTAALSARSGSQSNMFYDDQRGAYVGYHRTDSGRNIFGKTERRFVTTIIDNLRPPWPFKPLSHAEYEKMAETVRINAMRPWYLDNGPLTPGGVGPEYPWSFAPTDGFDAAAVDIYVPKAVKYAWAPDAYLAFPCVYYHYEGTKPAARSELGEERHGRGSGPIETQLMTSRDGVNWNRYPRPVWLNVGLINDWDIHQTYMAQGMVRRGDEIWMYTYNTEEYHSTFRQKPERRGIFRTVHRADRFVAARAPYDRSAMLYSRPLVFSGNRLVLNVDTAATGDLQVGLLDGAGRPIPGYGLDDCVYVRVNQQLSGSERAPTSRSLRAARSGSSCGCAAPRSTRCNSSRNEIAFRSSRRFRVHRRRGDCARGRDRCPLAVR